MLYRWLDLNDDTSKCIQNGMTILLYYNNIISYSVFMSWKEILHLEKYLKLKINNENIFYFSIKFNILYALVLGYSIFKIYYMHDILF